MPFFITLLLSLCFAVTGCGVVSSSSNPVNEIVEGPAITAETQSALTQNLETAIFAGGCFWGVEAVFESLKGVKDAKSGYVGGTAKTANYEEVSNGKSRHAEAVLVTYDPAMISYDQLLNVFFSVAHNPTELNRQGPDIGPQYRSAIFYNGPVQQQAAAAYIAEMDKAKVWPKKIVTQIVPLTKFYVAEEYHQDYLVRNPTQPYIVMHDLPKLADLKKKFPELYAGK